MYEYDCPRHGRFRTDSRGDFTTCPHTSPPSPPCHAISRRIWGFTYKPFTSHYNPATNTVVSSRGQFASDLARAEEAQNLRGISSTYREVDMRDKAALGVTNEGLDATYDNLRAQGRDDEARKLSRLMDED